MSRRIAAAAIVLGLAAGVGGGHAASASCVHADVAFYTTDATRLATELSKTPSACADYYVSVTPTATGAPRGGAVLASLRALGPRFHALAEIRLAAWAPYAAANGWFAAGVEVRRAMKAAGYDTSAGDSWAVNEVGSPSGTQMGVDVLDGAGTARQDFRGFVRGLYTGDDGVSATGLVFAADPLQVSADLSGYASRLRAWYSDAPFWADMTRYVRFWAQEAYADARAWGVEGASLEQRGAYLDDYFLHGLRLALQSDAARGFFTAAYLPVGNASYRWSAPDPVSGIGFGSTDVDAATMEQFVSAQTFALRASSPARFGFAVVPRSASPTDAVAVEDRLAAALQGSDGNAAGACGSDRSSCAGSVAGAQFTAAWQVFANTREGRRVTVIAGNGTRVTFAAVAGRGVTYATIGAVQLPLPPALRRRPGSLAYTIATTAAHTGAVTVCLPIDPAAYRVYAATLGRQGNRGGAPVRSLRGGTRVCGGAPTLGTFAVFARSKHAR